MRIFVRILAVLLGIALVVSAIGAALGYWSVRRSWPQTDGAVSVPGLTSAVDVLRDERGIPQIFADSIDDLYFAHGYTHAQDRFYEMDVRRHVTSGRLAEMFGEDQVPTDAFLRTLGWRRVAEQEIALINDESRRILDAYAAGVNAFLVGKSSAEVSLEYQVLALQNPDYSIETWDPVDSLAWLKALAWDLRGNMNEEANRALSASVVGVRRTNQLYPPYPYERNGTIVSAQELAAEGLPAGSSAQPAAAAMGTAAAQAAFRQVLANTALLDDVLATSGEGIGSNSWVVHGDNTETGQPLLANDPHLAPSIPSLWYQTGLHCRVVSAECPYDVSGWSMAGLPGIFIGHNGRIAWGFTNLGPDVTDLVLEQVVGDSYVLDGQRMPMSVRTETIRVAGGGQEQVTIRETVHGPIVSGLEADPDLTQVGEVAPVPPPGAQPPATVAPRGDGYEVALRWTALEPRPIFDGFALLNTALSWDDFRSAAQVLAVPSQNLVYADVDGNIGYQAPGVIPIRQNYDGKWPVPGWDSAYDWNGYIDFEDLPRTLNPEKGWITTANQMVVNQDDYPWPVQADFYTYGARAQRIDARITEVLTAGGKLTAQDMADIQMDAGNDLAAFLVPKLGGLPVDDQARAALQLLDGWDFQQPADSAAAAYFNAFYRHLAQRLFDDELTDTSVTANAGDRYWEAIRTLWRRPADLWWDDVSTAPQETRDETVVAALEAAAAEMVQAQGDDPAAWRWGDMHTLLFENGTLGTSGITPIEMIFNRGPEPTGGGGSIPLATGWEPADGYEVTWIPSMRQVIDMSDFDASTWVNHTGNSGHAYHPNYTDQIDAWLTGEQYPWPNSREAIDAATTQRLTLTP